MKGQRFLWGSLKQSEGVSTEEQTKGVDSPLVVHHLDQTSLLSREGEFNPSVVVYQLKKGVSCDLKDYDLEAGNERIKRGCRWVTITFRHKKTDVAAALVTKRRLGMNWTDLYTNQFFGLKLK